MNLLTVRSLGTFTIFLGLVFPCFGVVTTNPGSVLKGTGAVFDVNGSSIVTKIGTPTQVDRWNDALGSGIYFTERTAGNYAEITTFNGEAAIESRYTGAGTSNTILTAKTANGNDAEMSLRSLFLVTNVTDHSSPGYILGSTTATTEYGIRIQDGTEFIKDTTSTDFKHDGLCYVNGTQQLSGTTTSIKQEALIAMECSPTYAQPLKYNIGAFGFLREGINLSNRGFAGSVAEIVAFDYFLSADEIKITSTLLSTKYGLKMEEGSVYKLKSDDDVFDVFYLGRTLEDTNAGYFNVVSSGAGGMGIELTTTDGSEVFTDTANNGIFFSKVMTGGVPSYTAQTLSDTGLSFTDPDKTLVQMEWNSEELGVDPYGGAYALTFLKDDGTLEYLATTMASNGNVSFTMDASLLGNGTFGLQSVPEPASIWLFLFAMMGVYHAKKRRFHS